MDYEAFLLPQGTRLKPEKPGGLRCPFCSAQEQMRFVSDEGLEVVVFECFFSVTFEAGLSEEEKERRLEEAKAGKLGQ
ncbi:MAG: hypothetical protein QXT16_08455 [Candidatus Caldarchaeum sp.]